jgi:hypothetical protein
VIDLKDRESWKITKRRVEFKDHLTVYFVVNAFLAIINLWFSGGWFDIPLKGSVFRRGERKD